MGQRTLVQVERTTDGDAVLVRLLDPGLAGIAATLEIVRQAHVTHSRPVHAEQVLLKTQFPLRDGEQRVPLEGCLAQAYAYTGPKLQLRVLARLTIDDGVFSDTTQDVVLPTQDPLAERAAAAPDHRSLHSPSDAFDFRANLRAIPVQARALVLALLVVGLPLIAGNLLVGTRDQFVPESRAWLYDQRASDGDSESPFIKALAGSGGIGLALWLAIRRQLKRYMRFEASLPPTGLRREGRIPASELVRGQARVPLEGASVRVVAYNREHGQYQEQRKSKNGTRTVTVGFEDPVRAVLLYQHALGKVAANAPLQAHLPGEIDLQPLFDCLYPPQMVGASHGVSLRLEAQLLHPRFVDQEIELDPGALPFAEFQRAVWRPA
jgi:hypothetical protein